MSAPSHLRTPCAPAAAALLRGLSACAATLLAMALAAGPARAALVTFDGQAGPDAGAIGNGMQYDEAGLRFTSSIEGGELALVRWGAYDPWNADPGGATLLPNHIGAELIITAAVAGGTFTLHAFDLADAFNVGEAGAIAYVYTDAAGAHQGMLTLDEQVGLQTFHLTLAGLRELRFLQAEPYFQIDNLRFELDGPAEGVPAPAPWMLLAAGAAAGATRRSRAAR